MSPPVGGGTGGAAGGFFSDAAHFVYGLFLGWLWCVARVLMPTPAGRRRVSVWAALNALTPELVTVVTESSINSDSVCLLLHKLAALQQTVPITVVLDNARYQRCQRVQGYAAALGIELLFLPPYSPHLNLIERMWKFVKQQCLYTTYYPTFEAFKGAILRLIETANVEHKKALDSLLSLKFQSFRKVNVLIT